MAPARVGAVFFDEKSPAAWERLGKALALQAIFKDSTGMVLAQMVCNVFSLHQPESFEKATGEPSRLSYCPAMDREEIIALFVLGIFASAIIFGVAAFVL